MAVDHDYIEQLVLEYLAGIITPEDKEKLDQLIETEPEALAIWNELREELPDSYIEKVREELSSTLPVKEIIATIKKQDRQKKALKFGGGAAILLLAGMAYWFYPKPPVTHQKLAEKKTGSNKFVALQVGSNDVFDLGELTPQVKISFGKTVFYNRGDMLYLSGGEYSQQATITTPVAKDYKVRLPDGSIIWLYANSTITFSTGFNGSNREVTVKGEAYLEVAKNPSRPFQVHLPHSTVYVLGTAFSINTFDSSINVSLTEGRIRFQTANDSVFVSAGESVEFKQGEKLKTLRIDTTAILNRQKGIYDFNNSTVQELARVIPRMYGIEVQIKDKEVGANKFTAVLDKHYPLTKLLDNLRSGNVLDYKFILNDQDSTLVLINKQAQ